MMRWFRAATPLLFLIIACILYSPSSSAETAHDLTKRCKYTCAGDAKALPRMRDERYDRYWDGTGDTLTVTLPGETCQGVSLSFFSDCVPLMVETQGADGAWSPAARYDGAYRNAYIPFRAEGTFRLRALDPAATLKISRLTVWGEGALPDGVQRWKTLKGRAELMLIVTHPDDDLLWFGGLLPLYAGEQGRRVMVVYAVGEPSRRRVNELLDGLWTCGVRYYPTIGPYSDYRGSMAEIIKRFGGPDAMPTYLCGLLRRYQPQVVVTQGQKGEYGHPQHIAVVQAVIDAVQRAGDASFAPESAAMFGAYAPLKLYLHSHPENVIRFNWNEPLAAFNGRSGYEIAAAAFKKHVSQQKSGYRVAMKGDKDSQIYGLYFSALGPDEKKNDLFEHCPPMP